MVHLSFLKPTKLKATIWLILSLVVHAAIAQQHSIKAKITSDDKFKELSILEELTYQNYTGQALDTLFFYDWNNAFSSKNSPLAQRFAEEYVRKFHFASERDRGFTTINSVKHQLQFLEFKRLDGQPDIGFIVLDQALPPNASINLSFDYTLVIPDQRFTKIGWSPTTISLKNYLIEPALFTSNQWITYSHKGINDFPTQPINYELEIDVPKHLILNSSFKTSTVTIKPERNRFYLAEQQKLNNTLILTPKNEFSSIKTDVVEVVSNITEDKLRPEIKAIITDRISLFLKERIGQIQQDKIFVTESNYRLSPVYGLNQLPEFIRPFPDGFQYDIKLLKTLTRQYLKSFKSINIRQDNWLLDAVTVKLMIDYIDTYYPNMKLLGSFSEFFGVKWFHASDLLFNHKYQFIHETMVRQNLGQPVNLPKDQQLKFNQQLSNPYKSGIGLKYLEDYIGQNAINLAIQDLFSDASLPFTAEGFSQAIKRQTSKNTNWFFKHYIGSFKDIDFKIGKIKQKQNLTKVEILNLTQNPIPVKLGLYQDDRLTKTYWVEPFEGPSYTLELKESNTTSFKVNYDYSLPEFNQRNNTKRLGKLLNKPIQFRVLEDIEDPDYNQMFIIPEFTYNLYDGIAIGTKFYNTSLLPKNFSYKISPKYGFGSNALVGSASFDHRINFKQKPIFQIVYGLNGSRFSYNTDLFYNRYSGFLQFRYRPKNLRDNRRHFLSLRTVNVDQDQSPTIETDEPNYNVFNINYSYQNKNLDHFFTSRVDYEISQKFSKISASLRYRKLFNNNRQINLRFFAGSFLFNDNNDSDYFSFGIDRPTDYLFDYNYYGRSEDSGVFSQQFIMADAGFKSVFEDRFADSWVLSTNVSTTIWNWIFAYADFGYFKDRKQSAKFIYDSGIRLNLVEDYFEIYLPVYSKNGWEIAEDAYDQNIRFIVTLDFKTLFGLFKRRWY